MRLLSTVAFWFFLAFAVQAFVIVWLFVVTGDRRRDAALHRGEVIADARAKVNSCLTSRPQLAKINGFVVAVAAFHEAAYENAEALLHATPRDSPSYKLRVRNAERIRATVAPVRDTHFHVPTVAECLALGQTRFGKVAPTVPVTSTKVHP